jgi:hypothetical protein
MKLQNIGSLFTLPTFCMCKICLFFFWSICFLFPFDQNNPMSNLFNTLVIQYFRQALSLTTPRSVLSLSFDRRPPPLKSKLFSYHVVMVAWWCSWFLMSSPQYSGGLVSSRSLFLTHAVGVGWFFFNRHRRRFSASSFAVLLRGWLVSVQPRSVRDGLVRSGYRTVSPVVVSFLCFFGGPSHYAFSQPPLTLLLSIFRSERVVWWWCTRLCWVVGGAAAL